MCVFEKGAYSEEKKNCILPGSQVCPCDDCPFKKELERIDEFYNEFLVNGASFS